MKASFDCKTLLEALKRVKIALGDKQSPKTQNVKIMAATAGCRVAASSHHVGVAVKFQALEVAKEGEILCSGYKLEEILREADAATVQLEARDGESVEITAGFGFWETATDDLSLFTDFDPLPDDAPCHQIAGDTFADLVNRTAFAVARDDDSRFAAMKGILIEIEKGIMRMVGTDGKRLAVARGDCLAMPGAVDTTRATHSAPPQVMRMIAGVADDGVRVALFPDKIRAETDTCSVWASLVEGNYPDYRGVYPKTSIDCGLKLKPLLNALRLASAFNRERNDWQFGKEELTILALGTNKNGIPDGSGKAKTVVTPITFSGKPFSMHLDPDYITDFLAVVKEDVDLQILLAGSTSPIFFKVADEYDYIIMPLAAPAKAG